MIYIKEKQKRAREMAEDSRIRKTHAPTKEHIFFGSLINTIVPSIKCSPLSLPTDATAASITH